MGIAMGLVYGIEMDQGRGTKWYNTKRYSPEQEPSFTAFCEVRVSYCMITFNMERGGEGL